MRDNAIDLDALLFGGHIKSPAPLTRPGHGTGGERSRCAHYLSTIADLMRDLRHMGARSAPDLTDWLTFLDLEGKRARTLYSYHRELARLLRAYPDHRLEDFTAADISMVLRDVPQRSRHISRSIYKQFFDLTLLVGRLQVSPLNQVPRIGHPGRILTDIFTLAEVARLQALPQPDGGLFAILFGTGLRRGEARRLQRGQIDLTRGRLRVVNGKGGKDCDVALTPAAAQAVVDLTITEGLNPEDHLWCSHPGGGDVVHRYRPIGDTTYHRWYQGCLERADVPHRVPHTTRHTYHELMRLAGLTLEERQLLMGHASIRTTADIYGHLDFEAVAAKLATFHLEVER
jgi:integrase